MSAALEAARWARMKIRPERIAEFDRVALRLVQAKPRYKEVENRLKELGHYVPWWAIAVIHLREAGGPPKWNVHLGQGDPLDHVTIHEPAGRGPFYSPDAFLRGCLDALIDCAPHAAKWTDWTPGGALTILLRYNGDGYAKYGIASPYLWGGTTEYTRGKYVADHVFSAEAVDTQPGCAPIIARMMLLDKSIAFGGPSPFVKPTPAPVPASRGWFSSISNFFTKKRW